MMSCPNCWDPECQRGEKCGVNPNANPLVGKPLEAKEMEKAGKRMERVYKILESAKSALKLFIEKKRARWEDSTVCVFLDDSGLVIAFGESNWNKTGRGPEITRYLKTQLIRGEKGQENGYGGVQCAESEAILNAASQSKLGNVVYSLAYDQQSGIFKPACESCRINLKEYKITDLRSFSQ